MRLSRLIPILLLVALPVLASHGGDSYVLRLGDVTYMNGDGMSGTALKRIQDAHGRRFLWIRRGGRVYVTSSASALERAEALTQPQRELGSRQAALGSEQARLGMQQGALGTQQAALGGQQAQTRNDERQRELAKQQQALSEKQNELGKEQEKMGRQQQTLGEQQERLSREIEKKLGELADQLIRSGQAKEVAP
jgi:bla regulator protein BlaR1